VEAENSILSVFLDNTTQEPQEVVVLPNKAIVQASYGVRVSYTVRGLKVLLLDDFMIYRNQQGKDEHPLPTHLHVCSETQQTLLNNMVFLPKEEVVCRQVEHIQIYEAMFGLDVWEGIEGIKLTIAPNDRISLSLIAIENLEVV